MVKAWTHGIRSWQQPLAGLLAAGITAATLVCAGCSTSTIFAQQEEQRGHLLADSDVQQVQPGMTQEQVRGLLGTPDTTATAAPATFYYISSTMRGAAFLEPTEVERHILAVYFTPFGTVAQVANYTLKDGKIIDTIGRTTPSAHGDKSLIDKLFKGIGKKEQLFDPGRPN
jgi:outer membrane protein assembly factor BamE (lipoprotein component of BamABCDE complex)